MTAVSTNGSMGPADPVAKGLGVFSFALGIPQVLAPGRVNRMIGVRDDMKSRMWMRAVGVREIAAGIGIFSERRPTEWVWARVAGDTMDLALLGSALRGKTEQPGRTLAASVKQAARLETERGYALREAIYNCRNGGIISMIGVYGGFMDKFPIGAVMNRGLTIKTGQCHVQRYLRPLLQRVENGDIDPSFVVTHKMSLDDAPTGYETFKNKRDECVKVVLKP